MEPSHDSLALPKPSHARPAVLQVVAGIGLLLLSLGALAWQARHWLGITQEVCLCLRSCFAYLSCGLLSGLLTFSSDAFPLLPYRLKPSTGSNGRRTGNTSWGSGVVVCRRIARSVASRVERHSRPVVAAAQVHAACGICHQVQLSHMQVGVLSADWCCQHLQHVDGPVSASCSSCSV